MILHYQVFPEGADLRLGTPLIIVPGLFGSIANWRSVARKLSELRTVIVVDQRNHGRSPHADTHTYVDMVADLAELVQHLSLQKVDIAGHSMGGKVAMMFALAYPKIVSSLIVLDISPVTYEHSHAPFLQALLDVDLSVLQSRSEAEKALKPTIQDTPTRLFLLQSLAGSPKKYYWRLNLKVLHDYMSEIVGFPDVSNSSDVPCLVVRGEKSDYVRPEHSSHMNAIFPVSELVTIKHAGHWLHAEQPAQVISVIEEFLKK